MTAGERVRIAVRDAIASVDPARLVEADLAEAPFPLVPPTRLLSLGKSALTAARGALAAGARPSSAIVVAPAADVAADAGGWPDGWQILPGDHPVPGARSFTAGEALAAFAAADPEAPLLALVSGGGSALAERPRPPLTAADLEALGGLLLNSGRSIAEINTARRALSTIKGGGLLALRRGAVRTLLFSDVGDGDLAVIASGPTLPPPSGGASPLWIADAAREASWPEPILARLDAALRAAHRPAVFPPAEARLLSSPADLARAVARTLAADGFRATVLEPNLDAPTAEFVARLFEAAGRARAGEAVVLVGEPTHRVPATAPPGGRAAHIALAAAVAVATLPAAVDGDPTIFAAGSDGVDGTDGGAGALLEPALVGRLRRDPVSAAAALESYAAAGWLREHGARLPAAPTGVNLRDVFVVARAAPCDNLPER